VSSLFILTSCFSGITPPEARVALDPAGIANATYQRGPLSVNYRYKSQQNMMQISGDVQFQRGVDSLNVSIEFLDQEGKVLKRHLVYSSGYRLSEMDKSRNFAAELKIPDGATAFTFSSSEKERTGKR
jgi:hypothetical protein